MNVSGVPKDRRSMFFYITVPSDCVDGLACSHQERCVQGAGNQVVVTDLIH